MTKPNGILFVLSIVCVCVCIEMLFSETCTKTAASTFFFLIVYFTRRPRPFQQQHPEVWRMFNLSGSLHSKFLWSCHFLNYLYGEKQWFDEFIVWVTEEFTRKGVVTIDLTHLLYSLDFFMMKTKLARGPHCPDIFLSPDKSNEPR